MSQSVTIELSDALFDRLQKWSEGTHCSPGDFVSRALESSLPDVSSDLDPRLREELWALRERTDDDLKKLAREHLSDELHAELDILIAKRSLGEVSDREQARIDELIRLGNEHALKKAWAQLILKDRGIVLPVG